MDIIVYGRNEMERSNETDPHIKIIIHDPDLARPNINNIEACRDVLYLAFDDISYESKFDKYFTDEDAEVTCSFLEKWIHVVSKILISCEAGLSRSPGMAAAIHEFFNKTESIYFYDFDKEPNRLVYTKMGKALRKIVKSK